MQLRPAKSHETLVVMYHYVGQAPAGGRSGFVSIAEAEFDRQVRSLVDAYEPVDWPTFFQTRGSTPTGGSPRVLFTFDDGLRCQAECAARSLERHGVRGLFLVPGAVLAGQTLLDAHRLHILLSVHSDDEIMDALRRSLDVDACIDNAAADRIYHYEPSRGRRRLKYLLSTGLPAGRRADALKTLFADRVGDEPAWAARWYAPGDAWRDLARRGHAIGAHGFSHERLETLEAAAQLADLRASADAIAAHVGQRPSVMSYPLGSFDRGTQAAARSAGFVAALTTRHALDDGAGDPLQIPRVDCAKLAGFIPQTAEVS